MRQQLTDAQKKQLRKLSRALDVFLRTRDTMPTQYIQAFLQVCLEEGLGPVEYGKRLGIAQGLASRHLQDIGDVNRYKAPGHGWITQRVDPLDRRSHPATLTPEGLRLVHLVLKAMED